MGNGFGLFNEEQAMPWGPKSMLDVRSEFVLLARGEGANVSELCRRFEISTKTGYTNGRMS
jgi:hypothetical protein